MEKKKKAKPQKPAGDAGRGREGSFWNSGLQARKAVLNQRLGMLELIPGESCLRARQGDVEQVLAARGAWLRPPAAPAAPPGRATPLIAD